MAAEHCHYCGYDLAGIPARGNRPCPECGKKSPPVAQRRLPHFATSGIFALGLLVLDAGICFGCSYSAESGWAQAGIQFFIAPGLGMVSGFFAFLAALISHRRHGATAGNQLGLAAAAVAWGVGTALASALVAAAAAAFGAHLNPQSGC